MKRKKIGAFAEVFLNKAVRRGKVVVYGLFCPFEDMRMLSCSREINIRAYSV